MDPGRKIPFTKGSIPFTKYKGLLRSKSRHLNTNRSEMDAVELHFATINH